MTSRPLRRAWAVLLSAAVMATPILALAAPATDGDIRDIRGPIPIPPWWRWPLAIGVAALAAFAIVLLVRWWRGRADERLSPVERARRALALAEVEARAGHSRQWADLVSDTARAALAARLGVEVLHQTTAELSHAPWTLPPMGDEIDAPRLLALLGTCDLARFAKASLASASLLAETETARELTERLFAPPPRPSAKAPPQVHVVPT